MIVAGASIDQDAAWDLAVQLAERLEAPVWSSPMSGRASFPEDHRLFAGHLPPVRAQLAAKLGINNGDWATAESRRGTITLQAQVVTTIRPDTVFIPYHWGGPLSVNQLTISA